MIHQLYLEDIEPDHWVAWVLDLPGCFSSAGSMDDAITLAPQKIADYYKWVCKHDSSLPVLGHNIEVEVAETFRSFPNKEDPEYIVNAFFEPDQQPLSYWEVITAQRLLAWTRQDLCNVIALVEPHWLEGKISMELYKVIMEIIEHVGVAENWYFQQLGLGQDREHLPVYPVELIEDVRENSYKQLMVLIGESRVTQDKGENWSGRKILRRTLWHERDHTQLVQQILRSSEDLLQDT